MWVVATARYIGRTPSTTAAPFSTLHIKMPRRLKTTYSMLGLNGRALPPPPRQPQPEPEPELQADDEHSSDEDEDPRFESWHDVYVAEAEAEAADRGVSAVGRAAAGPHRPGAGGDPRVAERTTIPAVEGGGARVRQRREPRARPRDIAPASGHGGGGTPPQGGGATEARRAQRSSPPGRVRSPAGEARRDRSFSGKAGSAGTAPPAAMLHRQMREATKEKRARKQAAMAKNNDEAVPSSAPTDGP